MEHDNINTAINCYSNDNDLYSMISMNENHSRRSTEASQADREIDQEKWSNKIPSKPHNIPFLPYDTELWTRNHIQIWLQTIPNISLKVLKIFEEFGITGSDLGLLNHSKLAIIGISNSDLRTSILEAIVDLGIDVPIYPTIMRHERARKSLEAKVVSDKKTKLSISIPNNDNELDVEKKNVINSKNHQIAIHSRHSTIDSLKSTLSQFSISDYCYKIAPSFKTQKDGIDAIVDEKIQPPTIVEQAHFDSSFTNLKTDVRKEDFKGEDYDSLDEIIKSFAYSSEALGTGSKKSSLSSVFSDSKLMNSLLQGRSKYNNTTPSLNTSFNDLDLDSASMSGWLHVKKDDSLIWSKRYCIAIGSFLYISKTSKKFNPILVLEITSPSQIQPSPPKSKPNTFQISTLSDKNYHLSCATQFEMVQWINVLVRISDPIFDKSKRLYLIPIKRDNQEEKRDVLNDFILSSQQLRDSHHPIKAMTMEPNESMPDSGTCLPYLQGMKDAKYLPDRPRVAGSYLSG